VLLTAIVRTTASEAGGRRAEEDDLAKGLVQLVAPRLQLDDPGGSELRCHLVTDLEGLLPSQPLAIENRT
jgi:hypothetical protein